MLSICRAFQGIGVAAVVPNAMALIGRTYPVGLRRNVIFSCFGACGPTGFVVGAVFSSVLSQLACNIPNYLARTRVDREQGGLGVSGVFR